MQRDNSIKIEGKFTTLKTKSLNEAFRTKTSVNKSLH